MNSVSTLTVWTKMFYGSLAYYIVKALVYQIHPYVESENMQHNIQMRKWKSEQWILCEYVKALNY